MADNEDPPTIDSTGSNATSQAMAPTVMMFSPPVITASMMPRPDPSVERQSAEEWFRIFRTVAESLIGIYRTAGQEIVGQRQALSTLPSLLNRNESEKKLSTRIITECTSIEEAEELVKRTIGDLESECQASELIFNIRRGSKSLEDFYAMLIEKEKKAGLGRTVIIKKFIAELPDAVKSRIQKKFTEFRRLDGESRELTRKHIEDLYHLAREVYNEKFSKGDQAFMAEESGPSMSSVIEKQNQMIADMQEKLDAFIVADSKTTPRRDGERKVIRCFHCNKPGHTIAECWFKQNNQRKVKFS